MWPHYYHRQINVQQKKIEESYNFEYKPDYLSHLCCFKGVAQHFLKICLFTFFMRLRRDGTSLGVCVLSMELQTEGN